MRAVKQLGIFVWFCSICVFPVLALDPAEVAILVNRNSEDSVKLGEYYAGKRGVPQSQILALDLPMDEDLARRRYADYVVPTVRQWLTDHKLQDRIRCIVTTYGIPLRVNRRLPTDKEKAWLSDAAKALDQAVAELEQFKSNLDSIATALPPVSKRGTSAGQSKVDVEKLVDETEQALKMARKRAAAIKDEARRQKAEQLVADYQQALYPPPLDLRQEEAKRLKEERDALVRRLTGKTATADDHRRWMQLERELHGLIDFCRLMEARCRDLAGRETEAAFDSELSLLWWDDYVLYRWLPNPLTPEFDGAGTEDKRPVLMVGRLDAPTPEIVRRLVDDALAAEATGLSGNIYIDARNLGEHSPRDTYGEFDEHLRQAARWFQEKSRLRVVLDNKPALFQRGDCPDAALYCGWYSLGRYVDAFQWKRGAVGYHVASSEAATLRRRNSEVWCKRMIESGVAATLGPVAEPYLLTFPLPGDFFALLLTGKWTLVECYYRTTPALSWMMTLVGDPLYRPFARNPALKVQDLPSGLAIPQKWMR